MKLPVDENLARGLAADLADLFPGSIHVRLQTGNCSTAKIARLIRDNAIRFADFENDTRRSLLILK